MPTRFALKSVEGRKRELEIALRADRIAGTKSLGMTRAEREQRRAAGQSRARYAPRDELNRFV